MKLTQLKIKGFRNFKDATINFSNKSLVIGSNDVGKTNLIYAIRILLDRELSDFDIEPKDSDFYAFEPTNEYSILIKFENIEEDCILAKIGHYVNDNGDLYLKYIATRNPETRSKTYLLYAGFSEENLEEIQERYYRKVLNLKYIGCNRDLSSFIKRERKHLINDAKKNRDDEEKANDDGKLITIKRNLDLIDSDLNNLSFISTSTTKINEELDKLSIYHAGFNVCFDVGASDVNTFIDNAKLGLKYNENPLTIGGDGKNNQIFLALWTARNTIREENPFEVALYCIEEPEAHLHPHQQRKLAEYLSTTLKSQIIITTHSPQITSEFSPDSIIRLYEENSKTIAANEGCSEIIGNAIIDFGYRMSIIPAESFFANVVFLVEGPSEELFYKALAKVIDIDLDKHNISILMVDGVGFEIYTKILTALRIPWVIRTDNDIMRIPNKTVGRFAGIQRCLKIFQNYFEDSEMNEFIEKNKIHLSGFSIDDVPDENLIIAEEFIEKLREYNLFVAKKDLENDLINSELKEIYEEYLAEIPPEEIENTMKKRKATFMYKFLLTYSSNLSILENDNLASPLKRCHLIALSN